MSIGVGLINRIRCEIQSNCEKSCRRLGDTSPKLKIYFSEDVYHELVNYQGNLHPIYHGYNKEGYKIKFDGHPVFIVVNQTNYLHVSVEI